MRFAGAEGRVVGLAGPDGHPQLWFGPLVGSRAVRSRVRARRGAAGSSASCGAVVSAPREPAVRPARPAWAHHAARRQVHHSPARRPARVAHACGVPHGRGGRISGCVRRPGADGGAPARSPTEVARAVADSRHRMPGATYQIGRRTAVAHRRRTHCRQLSRCRSYDAQRRSSRVLTMHRPRPGSSCRRRGCGLQRRLRARGPALRRPGSLVPTTRSLSCRRRQLTLHDDASSAVQRRCRVRSRTPDRSPHARP